MCDGRDLAERERSASRKGGKTRRAAATSNLNCAQDREWSRNGARRTWRMFEHACREELCPRASGDDEQGAWRRLGIEQSSEFGRFVVQACETMREQWQFDCEAGRAGA
eukprot:652087-Pleurochrysis_carterae.AAC.1